MKAKTKIKVQNFIFLLFVLVVLFFYYDSKEKPFSKKVKITETNEMLSCEDSLQISFLDVGEADATLICDHGEVALVDAGNNEDGKNLVTYLKEQNISSFKYVFGTHAHEDHIGGMDNVIRDFSIEHYYMPKTEVEYMTFQEIKKELEKKNISWETPNIGEKFPLKKSMIEVLSVKDDPENINDTSIVLRVTYQDTSFLLMGDASYQVENELLEKEIKSDVLKIGHHGSSDSTSANFLKKVNPNVVVISVGEGNDYHHPHDITLKKINYLEIPIYRTDVNGTIKMTSDGKKIKIECINTNIDGKE